MTTRQLSILTIVGGILAAAGSLLPWATITSGFGAIDVAGTRGDGLFSLALGAAVALVGFVRYGSGSARLGIVTTILGGLVLALGAFELVNLNSRIGDAEGDVVRLDTGVGLYLVIVGGAIALIDGMKGKSEPGSPPTSPSTSLPD